MHTILKLVEERVRASCSETGRCDLLVIVGGVEFEGEAQFLGRDHLVGFEGRWHV